MTSEMQDTGPASALQAIEGIGAELLEFMTDALIEAEGFIPTELETPAVHKSRMKLQIKAGLQTALSSAASGLEVLSMDEDDKTAELARALSSHLQDPKALGQCVSEIGEDARIVFSASVSRLFDKGDFHRAREACAVLGVLAPFDPVAIAFTGSIIGELEGRPAACSFYDKVVELFEHPLTSFFAADAFYEDGDKEQARKILLHGLSLCDRGMDPDGAYRPMIEEFLRSFS